MKERKKKEFKLIATLFNAQVSRKWLLLSVYYSLNIYLNDSRVCVCVLYLSTRVFYKWKDGMRPSPLKPYVCLLLLRCILLGLSTSHRENRDYCIAFCLFGERKRFWSIQTKLHTTYGLYIYCSLFFCFFLKKALLPPSNEYTGTHVPAGTKKEREGQRQPFWFWSLFFIGRISFERMALIGWHLLYPTLPLIFKTGEKKGTSLDRLQLSLSPANTHELASPRACVYVNR